VPPATWAVLSLGILAGVLAALGLQRLLSARARRSLQSVKDGIRSFRDGDFSLRLAVTRHDEIGELVGLYNELADALRSERHEIVQRELLLESMLQSAPMAVLLLNAKHRVVFANRAARQILGGGRSVLGRPFVELEQAAPDGLREALASGTDALLTLPGPPGGEETLRLTQRTFTLNTQSHTLLTVERIGGELRRQEADVWKKTIRVINHELNNSLAPVSSLVHSARHVLDSKEHGHRLPGILESIDERVRHLNAFLEGYARFARLPRPTKARVSPASFIEGVRRVCDFRIDGDLPRAETFFDEIQMQQVLLNLLKNAYEAGGPPEAVTVSVAVAPGGAVLSVLDRGTGMTEDVMRQALLPFYSSKPAGAGLGLALCREILEAHGGRLLLQNREGGGLAATCWLPPE